MLNMYVLCRYMYYYIHFLTISTLSHLAVSFPGQVPAQGGLHVADMGIEPGTFHVGVKPPRRHTVINTGPDDGSFPHKRWLLRDTMAARRPSAEDSVSHTRALHRSPTQRFSP